MADTPRWRGGMTRWAGGVLLDTLPHTLVDVRKATATAVEPPGCRTGFLPATYDTKAIALCAGTTGKLLLQERTGDGWRRLTLPPGLRVARDGKLAIAADDEVLVILTAGRLDALRDGKWTTAKVDEPGPAHFTLSDPPTRSLLFSGRLYLAYNQGEWGGQLVSLDLQTLQWRLEPPGATAKGASRVSDGVPVSDLAIDRRGRLWAVRGLAHLSLAQGALSVFENDKWRVVASAFGSNRNPTRAGAEGTIDLDGTSFKAIAFDSQDRLYLGTSGFGVVRRNETGWTPTIPDQNVNIRGLAFVDGTLVIANGNNGVLLFNPKTQTTRRVSFSRNPPGNPPSSE